MGTVVAVLLIIVGVAWPMGVLLWLNARLNRQPPLAPRKLGLILALNGILPVSLILTAFRFLSPNLRDSPVLLGVLIVSWLAVLILAAVLVASAVAGRAGPESEG